MGIENKRQKKNKELLVILVLIFFSSSLPLPVYLTCAAESLIHHGLICFYEPAKALCVPNTLPSVCVCACGAVLVTTKCLFGYCQFQVSGLFFLRDCGGLM